MLELTGQRDPILLANLAWNLKNQGRMKEARTLYEEFGRRCAGDPPDPARLCPAGGSGPQLRRRGEDARQGWTRCSRTIQGVRLTRAVLLGRMRSYDEALAMIDATADDEGKLGPNELLEKGRLLDQVGRYDDAWAAFAEGKRLGARTVRPGLSRRGGRTSRSSGCATSSPAAGCA